MNPSNTSSVSSDEEQKSTPYNATLSKNITPSPTLLSSLFNPKPTPKALHNHSIAGDYSLRQQQQAQLQASYSTSNVAKQQNNDTPAYQSHSPMFLDGNRYYEQWQRYLHENQMLSPSVQGGGLPPYASAAKSGENTSQPAANGTWQSRMMQHENQMLSSSDRGRYIPPYATKPDDLSRAAANVPSRSNATETHHIHMLLQQQLALLKKIESSEVSSDFVQPATTEGGTGKRKRGRPRKNHSTLVMHQPKTAGSREVSSVNASESFTHSSKGRALKPSSKASGSSVMEKKETKKRTVTKKAEPFEPTPSQEERINAAIHSVNAKYGVGDEKQKKLATVKLTGITQRASTKWQAQVYFAGKSRYIGVFESREDAALAYEVAKEVLRSEDAHPLTEEEVNTASEISIARKAAFTIISPVEKVHSGK